MSLESIIASAWGPGGTGGGKDQVPAGQAVSVLAPPGLVSVLIPCLGQLEYTKLCLPSVLRHSRAPYELVFLDVGSLDGTAEYLAGLAAGVSVRVEVVRTLTDQGIEAACREALARARGEFLVLLNNDTVVPEGWLDQLVALASLSPAIGLVGPMSNHAAPPQLVEGIPYRLGTRTRGGTGLGLGEEHGVDVSAVHRFAREWREKNQGKWQ